ncbi:hypothetical protein [Pseudomaricurvus sp.]|uniref:hypothetical protein n=1 Tax=Pseudomaricurvus sp. TaxID=2004510 RepID=UPI003F6B6F06
MLLNAIIIVLRETLEAGILMSVLLTVGRHLGIGGRWFLTALVMGVSGAFIYAQCLGAVSQWFDYAGQEVVNALLQYSLYLCLVVICVLNFFWVSLSTQRIRMFMTILLGASVVLACIREGSEIMIFFLGFLADRGMMVKALTSGFVGLMIGISVGALCFYAIMMQARNKARNIQLGILGLVAGGMVIQATQLLIQIDWIPSTEPVWNISHFLPESSIVGQLLYAIFGYEASPTWVEVLIYSGSLLLIPITLLTVKYVLTVRATYSKMS